jgi:hypothetical protein
MRVWLACFLVLFALAELFDWLQKFNLPLPIYILGGAFLAVASNYDKILYSYFADSSIEASLEQPQLDLITPSTNPISSQLLVLLKILKHLKQMISSSGSGVTSLTLLRHTRGTASLKEDCDPHHRFASTHSALLFW